MLRRRWIMVGIGIVLGGYLTLTALTHITALPPQANTVEGSGGVEGNYYYYNLPSLEDVIQSVQDLDVQRVLRVYGEQHKKNPSPTATSPSRVIISSTWRSGSTLLGEVLSSHPAAYYHYEPMMQYGLQQIGPTHSNGDEIRRLLRDLLHCDYKHADDYLKFAYTHHDMFTRNSNLWAMCSSMPRSKCYAHDTLSTLCSLFPVQVMKVVRARLELLSPLLSDPNTTILWLVRDPRAVMNSRISNVDWCIGRACADPQYLCSDLSADLSTFLRLRETKPTQVMLIRYEDWARDPYNRSETVMKLAGLTLNTDVREYLDDHLRSEMDEPWSTRHNPRTRIGKWMRRMKYEDVLKVQYHCRSVMRSLGYRLFVSKADMDAGNAIGLLNVP